MRLFFVLIVAFFVFVCTPMQVAATELFKSIIVKKNMVGHIPEIQTIDFNSYKDSNADIFLTESGLRCWVSPWSVSPKETGPVATIECTGPGDYRFQTTLACNRHNGEKNPFEFFIGIVGKLGANRNFSIWCIVNRRSSTFVGGC